MYLEKTERLNCNLLTVLCVGSIAAPRKGYKPCGGITIPYKAADKREVNVLFALKDKIICSPPQLQLPIADGEQYAMLEKRV